MNDKIRPTHLDRRAAVYLRQSSLKQVHEHRESTARQYALQERATELGSSSSSWSDSSGSTRTSADAKRSTSPRTTAHASWPWPRTFRRKRGGRRTEAGTDFAIDIFHCPRCGGRRRIVGVHTGGESLRALLERLGLDRASPSAGPTRSPPRRGE